MRLRGEFQKPGPDFTGQIEIDGDNLPFDEKMAAALPEKTREVVRTLQPQGTFNVHVRSGATIRGRAPQQQIVMRLNRCSMCYSKFPYAVNNVRGVIEAVDRCWTFRDLEGTNDTAVIHGNGTLVPAAEGDQLTLNLTGANIPLEEELRDALPPNVQHLWTLLKPRGSCDARCEVTYQSADKKLGLKIDAKPRPEVTSIEPVAFPYRLEKLRGTIHYRDGHVDLRRYAKPCMAGP